MQDVIIAGIGQTPVAEHWEISLRELAWQAMEAAMQDSGGLRPQALYVANTLSPALSGQTHLGVLLADFAGLTGIEAAVIEAAGASGGAAFRQAYLAVAAGAVDSALVVGVEKVTDKVGSEVESAAGLSMDSDYESPQGMTLTAQSAILMRRYLHEHGLEHEVFAGFPLTAHTNGAGNPNAMFRKAINIDTYRSSGMVSDPLNLFDVAPLADGAAAVLLTRRELVPPAFPHRLVRVSGSSLATDTLALHDRQDPLALNSARLSVERACRQAGIRPQDVDFFELYDSSSIMAALSLEAAGYAGRGEGWKLAVDGAIGLQGSLPIAVMGGLKARGNPLGAVGVYQIVEAALQLRGQAGKNQLGKAQRAMVQALGGPASTAVTHVLESLN